MPPLSQQELDWVYELPYMRTYHPCYEPMGGVPAIREVEFSITHNRGCLAPVIFVLFPFIRAGHYGAERGEYFARGAPPDKTAEFQGVYS